jgi:hypothetical protein
MRSATTLLKASLRVFGVTPTACWGFAFVILLQSALASDSALLDRIEGYYAAPSPYCSDEQGKRCDPPLQQCLLIRRVDSRHAKFSFYSVQLYGDSCAAEGVADLRDNKLVYTDENPKDVVSNEQGIVIAISGDRVRLKYLKEPQAGTLAFCGAHANLERIEFRLSDRQPVDHQKCGG